MPWPPVGSCPISPSLLDLDPVAGMRRIAGRPLDAFERMDLDFHRRVREGYLEIARDGQAPCARASTRRPMPDRLHAQIARGVDEALGRREPRHGA